MKDRAVALIFEGKRIWKKLSTRIYIISGKTIIIKNTAIARISELMALLTINKDTTNITRGIILLKGIQKAARFANKVTSPDEISTKPKIIPM